MSGSTSEPPIHRVTEVKTKAQAVKFLPSLQRGGRVTCLVEFVGSGSRLRVYIPKESCLCQVVLAGINCPRSSFRGNAGEPYGDEAAELTRRLTMQVGSPAWLDFVCIVVMLFLLCFCSFW